MRFASRYIFLFLGLSFLWGSGGLTAAELTPFKPVPPTVAPSTGVPSLPQFGEPPLVAQPPTVTPSIPLPGEAPPPAQPPQLGVPPAVSMQPFPQPAAPGAVVPEPVPTPQMGADQPTQPLQTPLAAIPTPGGGGAGQPLETGPETALRPVDKEDVKQIEEKVEEEGVYFNVADEDINEVIKQISRATGKNFILGDKIHGKITIISDRKMTKEEIWETFLSALEVAGYTTVQGPAGLIKLVALRDALSSPIPLYKDQTPFTDQFITRLVTLKNISAIDMSTAIKALVSKEGNLFAYPATNTLIVTDTGTNIKRIIELVEQLDTEGPQETLQIIHIKYATAKDIADKITQLFEVEGSSGGGQGQPARGRGAQQVQQLSEVPPISKVIPDERTNTIIILATKVTLAKVREVIAKLDVLPEGLEEGRIHVHYLKNANAKELADTLSQLTQAAQSRSQQRGAAGAKAGRAAAGQQGADILVAEFEGGIKITADENTNALIITASSKDYRTLVDRVIDKLDIPRRQVYVEAVIMELSMDSSRTLGTGVVGGKTFTVGGADIAGFGNTFGFLDPAILASGFAAGAANTGNTVDFNLPSTGGTASQISVPAFLAAIVAVQGDTDINILSTPNLLTVDNEEAEIIVGREEPFPVGQASTTGGVLQTTFERQPVALTLKLTPQINESDSVRLQVEQSVEDILPSTAQGPLASLAGPSTSTRSIKTTVIAKDNQTIVIGGLMQDRYTTQVHKVPLLGDIPILGYLFKSKTKTKVKANLMVFLTPHVIREANDFLTILKRKIDERNNFLDKNFSKKDRKQMREAIRNHAEHLLEYHDPIQAPYDYSGPPTGQSGLMEMQPSDVEGTPGAAPPPSVIDLEKEIDDDVDLSPESEPGYSRQKASDYPDWRQYSEEPNAQDEEQPRKKKSSQKRPGRYQAPPPPEKPALPEQKDSDKILSEEDMDLAL